MSIPLSVQIPWGRWMTGSPLVLELSDVTLVATSREEGEVSEMLHRSSCIQPVTVPKPGTKRASKRLSEPLWTTKVRAARLQVAFTKHASSIQDLRVRFI